MLPLGSFAGLDQRPLVFPANPILGVEGHLLEAAERRLELEVYLGRLVANLEEVEERLGSTHLGTPERRLGLEVQQDP